MPVSDQLEHQLQRWTEAGILDVETAERVREFESADVDPSIRWPVIFAIAFGSIMVAAGVLLFVAAHWDDLSPAQRFLLVLLMIVAFHLTGGAFMPRMRSLGMALHAVGTAALGGGIFLAGQIFNLQEHWPGGILLWAIGAVLTWFVLRDWIQATLSALLVPAWVASEWGLRGEHYSGTARLLVQFLTLVAITYLSARHGRHNSYFRRALVWVGGLSILPLCAVLAAGEHEYVLNRTLANLPLSLHVVGLLTAFLLPLVTAFILRRKLALWNVGYACWVYLLGLLDSRKVSQNVTIYLLCVVASVGLVVWGLRESRRERINLGVAGFAITIIVFYFSAVIDKLGRSASLVGFGILFLVGGWQLEQLRRKLVARTRTASSDAGGN